MCEEKNGGEEGHQEDMDLDLHHNEPSSFNGNIYINSKREYFQIGCEGISKP
jgi:hypothetical protein